MRGAQGYLSEDFISKIKSHMNAIKKSIKKAGGM